MERGRRAKPHQTVYHTDQQSGEGGITHPASAAIMYPFIDVASTLGFGAKGSRTRLRQGFGVAGDQNRKSEIENYVAVREGLTDTTSHPPENQQLTKIACWPCATGMCRNHSVIVAARQARTNERSFSSDEPHVRSGETELVRPILAVTLSLLGAVPYKYFAKSFDPWRVVSTNIATASLLLMRAIMLFPAEAAVSISQDLVTPP